MKLLFSEVNRVTETHFTGRSGTPVVSKMEPFAIIVKGFQKQTITAKVSNFDVARLLDPLLPAILPDNGTKRITCKNIL